MSDIQDKIQKIINAKKNKKQTPSFGAQQDFLQQQKLALNKMGIKNPFFKTIESLFQNTAVIEGKQYLNYSSYDYLGLSGHPHVSARAMQAIQCFGTSCSASRLVGGEKGIHHELEQGIARLLNVEDSLVFVGGYTTNVSTIEHLFSSKDLILHDSLAHKSILMGTLYSGARKAAFPHQDRQTLEAMLKENRHNYEKVLIVIEGVYSMDGDIPDLSAFIQIKKKYNAFLMVDEAHSVGVLGKQGKGISEYAHIDSSDVDIWMGTLSKTFASCGGYIAGSGELIDYLKYTTPGFVYSVGMSPGNTGAALGALEVFIEEPQRVAALQERSRLFLKLCVERGFNVGTSKDSAVIPVITGSSEKALYLADELFKNGINVQPIFYPAVDESAARLRFFLTCQHTEEQITSTVELIERSLIKINSNKNSVPFII